MSRVLARAVSENGNPRFDLIMDFKPNDELSQKDVQNVLIGLENLKDYLKEYLETKINFNRQSELNKSRRK